MTPERYALIKERATARIAARNEARAGMKFYPNAKALLDALRPAMEEADRNEGVELTGMTLEERKDALR